MTNIKDMNDRLNHYQIQTDLLKKMDGWMSEHEISELTEPQLKINMLKYLSSYFNCQEEVWSTYYKKRIDIIAVHKADLDKKYPIGMELKTSSKKRGKDLADWLKQAIVYTTKDFIGYGKCMIITVPQVSFLYLNEGLLMNHHEIYERGGK